MINVRSEREVSCKRLIQQRNYCKTSSTTLHATIEAKTCDRLRHKSSEPNVIEMKCLSQQRNMCSCEADNWILLRRFYPSLNDATATLGCQLRHETRRALAGRPAIAKIAKLVGNQLSRAATCNCYCCFSLFSLSLFLARQSPPSTNWLCKAAQSHECPSQMESIYINSFHGLCICVWRNLNAM